MRGERELSIIIMLTIQFYSHFFLVILSRPSCERHCHRIINFVSWQLGFISYHSHFTWVMFMIMNKSPLWASMSMALLKMWSGVGGGGWKCHLGIFLIFLNGRLWGLFCGKRLNFISPCTLPQVIYIVTATSLYFFCLLLLLP